MPKKLTLKTSPTKKSVTAFIAAIEDPTQRQDSKALLSLFRSITKKKPLLWGDSIIGFGTYTYARSNGDTAEFLAAGFAPRKNSLSLYIMPGYQNLDALLKKLGPHKKGRACLTIKRLSDIDMATLEKIITAGYQEMEKRYTVT